VVLTDFQNAHPEIRIVVHINSINLGPAQSRNIGVQMATGSVILFLDDDCRPMPHWYSDLGAAWESVPLTVMGIGSFIVPSELNSFNGQFCLIFSPIKPWPIIPGNLSLVRRIKNYYRTPNPVSLGPAYLSGASMSFRKEAFTKVGGFSPSLRISEDIDICQKLRTQFGDKSLVIIDTYSMPHDFSNNFLNTLKRSFSYGQGSGKNFWRGDGGLSFNPGPLLILALISLFLVIYSLSGASVKNLPLIASLLLLSLIFFYSLLVTGGHASDRLRLFERLKFGLAFLLCECANTLGFFSASIVGIKKLWRSS
jgi:glycosyltransferase involved in cell wall biosynthesis